MATWSDIESGIAYLQERTEEMRTSGMRYAEAEAEYRKRKAIAILDERQKGTPATLCKEIIFARPDMIEALTERNCAEAVYNADKESINSMKLKLRVLDAQLARDWQASGERGY
ncbi:MAG: hypothetical protein IJ113_03695 [Eggerthellaceae bacterium]|nr:hypothetical protein [Eggerthellaceae bacterium]